MNEINKKDIGYKRLTVPKEDDSLLGTFTAYTSITNSQERNYFKEVCNICGSELHNRFPEGFPDKYKICCKCSMTAYNAYQIPKTPKKLKEYLKMLKKFGYVEEFKDTKKSICRYRKYKKKFDNLFIIKKGDD